MFPSVSLISLLVATLPLTSFAHPYHHDHECRDLARVYYGPDSNNTKYTPPAPDALGPAVDPKIGYRVEDLGSGTYLVTDGIYQAMFLVSTHGVILVDAPPTLGYNLFPAIQSVTNQTITYLVYSHHHSDHIGAASLFNGTVKKYIAQKETLALLQELPTPDPTRPFPNSVFSKDKTLHLGNQTLRLSYKGPNHEPGNIFIYAPAAKTIMLVDVVYPRWAPFSELGQSQNIPNWISAHDQILSDPFEKYLGGHLNQYGTRQDVQTQKEHIQDLFTFCSQALTDPALVNTTAVLGPVMMDSPGNPWAEFKVYLKAVTDACAEKTNRKWEGRLSGLDAFGWENAYKMVESVRIDFGVLGDFGVRPRS